MELVVLIKDATDSLWIICYGVIPEAADLGSGDESDSSLTDDGRSISADENENLNDVMESSDESADHSDGDKNVENDE